MKKLTIIISSLFFWSIIYGQGYDTAVIIFLKKVHNAYAQPGKLSFQVDYRYSNKSQPGKALDSMSGNISMDKDRMYFNIAGSETIINSKYSIKIIPDEQLIYLGKVQRDGLMDPVSILDTLLVKAAGGHASLVKGKQTSTLHIRYPETNMYKQVSMTIDERTGLFQKVVYDIRTAGLVTDEEIAQPGHPAPYESEGKVEVVFSKYQKGNFTDSLFDETQYVKRQGNNFEPTARYNGYRVFVASPNL
jgi:hypothetical protein